MSYAAVRERALIAGGLVGIETDLAVIGLAEGAAVGGAALEFDQACGGAIARALANGDFKGESNETLVLYPAQGSARRLLLVGLGKAESLNGERMRAAAATAARKCRDLGAKKAAALLFGEGTPVSAVDAGQAFAEGAIMGTYQYLEYKTKDRDKVKVLDRIEVFVPSEAIRAEAAPGFARGERIADATNFARTLAAHPGNHATPSFLAAEAERIAASQKLRCTVFDAEKMRELGMGALLGVAKGSHEPARFILLEYDCGRADAPTLALVGKGLTFDAGGISIKPAAKMEDMKYDMCGGAAVLGVMSVIRDLEVGVNVVAAVPSTENLPGGGAYKPGDILRSYSGKTIEVQNCDAEGRLILADALSYVVQNHKPAAVIDLATLTGAVVIALGHYGAGLLTNDDALAQRIQDASRRSGDRLWRLPIWEEMADHLKSDFADVKNIADGSAGAGTIAGAAFLANFVDSTPWAHIDIAGTAWWEKDRPHLPKGPSGYGVRLLAELLRSWT